LCEDEDAVAEGHQGRDRPDPGSGGQLLLGLGVDLAEDDVGVLLRRGLEDRAKARQGARQPAQKSTSTMPSRLP
jgi:hypothetical protein